MPGLSGKAFILQTPSDAAKAIQDAVPADGDFDGVELGFEENEFNPEFDLIETTNKNDDENQTFLEGHGVFRGTVTGSGFLQNNALMDGIESDFYNRRARWWRVTKTDDANWKATGKFMLSTLPQSGSHDGAVKYSINLMSHGPVTVVR